LIGVDTNVLLSLRLRGPRTQQAELSGGRIANGQFRRSGAVNIAMSSRVTCGVISCLFPKSLR
jgi:hypothetical protein